MQYKGFRKMKRVAAVILSAAIMVTDIQGVSAAEYGQTVETEVPEKETTENETSENETSGNETSENETLENEASEIKPSETETLENNEEGTSLSGETIQPETNTELGTGEEQTAADLGDETEMPETEMSETEMSETEMPEIETTGNEAAESQETETGTEAVETETKQEESVPVPEVDDSVYEPENINIADTDNAAPFTVYNAQGTLETNEQGEYVIGNRDQFIAFLASDTDYAGKTVRLNCDVDMKGETAQLAKAFGGTLEGNGHSIYNYKAEGGLFRQIDGTVRGLHLSKVSFSQERSSAALAVTNNGIISDITVNADITVVEAMTATAGVVLDNAGTMSDCVFAGSITAGSGTDNDGMMIGGIVSSNTGIVKNCHAFGSVNTNAAVIGGIVARNYGEIENCKNYMSLTGAYCVGGIVAENTSTITGCENYAVVMQKNSSVEGLSGGIAGKNTGTVSSCANFAEISGAYKNIGGIAGSSSKSITGCANYASVSGSENVGGIAGLFNGTGSAAIKNSFNKGKINAVSNSSSNNQGIGGILGAASGNAAPSVENCYNTEVISGAADTKYIGGIVGVLYKGSIKNVYNTGEVTAASATDSFQPCAAMIAGFLGAEEDAGYTGSLFLEGNSDILCYRENGAVTAENEKKTSDELKSADALTILGDGFASDESGINGGYPVIKGQSAQNAKYIIMYEPNGGCADYYFSVAQDGASLEVPASPSKKNASFLGWFKDSACSEKYSFSSGVTKSAVIYAGWETFAAVEDITLAQTEVTLIKDESFNLKEKVVFEPKDAENTALTFSSSDTSVATVDDTGVVRAIGEGTAKISVKLADGSLDKELFFTVTVSNRENIVRFKLYDDESNAEITRTTISVNEPVTVQAVFGANTPKDATVQWSSSRPDYVKVTERTDLIGTNAARLDGLKPTTELDQNSVDVMCTLIYPDKKTTFTGTLKVIVRPLAETISVQVGKEDATDKTVIYDIGTKKFIAVGNSVAYTKLSEPTDTLSALILPKDANQKVKWSSSNSEVITFDDEESGTAKGYAIGEATVTAAAADGSKGADGKPVTGKVTVKTRRIIQTLSFTPKTADGNGNVSVDANGRIEIAEGASIKLVPTYDPTDATVKKLSWSNGNPNALELTKVEEGTNILTVTAKKVAQNTTVKLTAETTDMGGAFCEIEFIIKPKVEKIKIFRTDDTDRANCLSGKNIGIDPEKDNMTFSLMAVNEPDNASQLVTWKINNTKVADFKDNEDGTCTVKVKGMGTAVITATATDGSKITATTMLNVTSLASNVEIEGSNMVMKGKTIKLKATVYPKSANNKNIKWLSLAPEYATVNGSTGEVKGVKAGFALISAVANDGSGVSGTHAVWVKDPVESFDIMIPDGDDNVKNDKLLTGKTIGLDPDENKNVYTVAARILPDTACQDVEWKSSNEKVATVEDGVITAKALGKTTITATAIDGSGRKASVTVNIATLVKSIKITGGHYLGVDQELQLKAEVGDKDATSKSVIWKSSVPKVATVDENGLVIAEGRDGETVITAEAADGSGIKAEHKIYVVGKKNDVSISAYENCEIWTKNKKKYVNDIDLSDQKVYTIRLKAELSNGSAIRDGVPMDINWSSSNKGIATVEPEKDNSSVGVVTIYKAGVVKITATSTEGYETSDNVTVTVTNKNPYVEITGPGHRLAGGKKMQLSAGGAAVDWYSENEQIAKVNKNGQVTACKNASGVVNIRAEAVDGNHFDTYAITVGSPVQEVDVTLNGYVATDEKVGIDLMRGYNGSTEIKLGALLDGVQSSDVTWKTSNKSIAVIDEDGYVDIKKNGNVTFTATATDGSNKKGKVTLVVTKQITDMSPTGQIDDIEVGLKKSVQLSVDYKPLSCTVKKAIWESSDPSIASVNKKNGKVTGKGEGVAVITATAADNSKVSCSFVVTVNPAVGKVEVVRTIKNDLGIETSESAYQEVIGIDLSSNVYTVNLKANLYTKQGKEYTEIDSQRVSWKSSNENIAKVDENGVVTGLKSGEVTITASALDGSKKSGKVKIYVGKLIKSITPSDKIKDGISLNLRLKEKKTMELAGELTINPITATNQGLTYTSSDKRIVTVNANGKVTAKKEGDAVITITPKDGSGIIVEIPVTVTK